tara:strand:+ start:510 stop:1106 length:597 start_codon:yes stop_codon:yes gene_type:complete
MNHYTEVLRYIKELSLQDPLVNVVTQGEYSDLDIDKMNVFPFVHVQVSGAGFTNGSTVLFNVQIGAVTDRNTNKTIIGKEYFGNDNEVDNLNDMLAVLNRLWTKMYSDFEDNNIIASENPSLEITKEDVANGLDGWIISFDIEMPNKELSLCQGLPYSPTSKEDAATQFYVDRVEADGGTVTDRECVESYLKGLIEDE